MAYDAVFVAGGQSPMVTMIDDAARKLPDTHFVVTGKFKPFATHDGNLITGRQQFSDAAAAEQVVPTLGR